MADQYNTESLGKLLKLNRRFNAWIEIGPYEVYVRCSQRFLPGKAGRPSFCLDIANVVNQNERLKGHGGFWKLLDQLEHESKAYPHIEAVLIECVQNQRLALSLRERAWHETGDPFSPTFIKVL